MRKWLVELREVRDVEALLRPFALVPDCWPTQPLVPPSEQLTWHDAAALEQHGRILESVSGDGARDGTGEQEQNTTPLRAC